MSRTAIGSPKGSGNFTHLCEKPNRCISQEIPDNQIRWHCIIRQTEFKQYVLDNGEMIANSPTKRKAVPALLLKRSPFQVIFEGNLEPPDDSEKRPHTSIAVAD